MVVVVKLGNGGYFVQIGPYLDMNISRPGVPLGLIRNTGSGRITSTWSMIWEEAYATLRNIPSFKRVSQFILRSFTLDVTLIAVGVRYVVLFIQGLRMVELILSSKERDIW